MNKANKYNALNKDSFILVTVKIFLFITALLNLLRLYFEQSGILNPRAEKTILHYKNLLTENWNYILPSLE